MVGVPINFRRSGSVATPVYDFQDIADGSGYVKFICTSSAPAGTLTYHLLRTPFEAGNIVPTTVDNHNRRFAICPRAAADITFTTSPFKTPKIIQGKVYVMFTIVTTNANGQMWNVTATLKKNSTSLGNASCYAGTTGTSAASQIITFCLTFDVSQTLLAIGDTLSLYVNGVVEGAGTRCFILHDSLNRDVSSYVTLSLGTLPAVTATDNPSELAVYIPFKINL